MDRMGSAWFWEQLVNGISSGMQRSRECWLGCQGPPLPDEPLWHAGTPLESHKQQSFSTLSFLGHAGQDGRPWRL
jgi:hypothetical protein